MTNRVRGAHYVGWCLAVGVLVLVGGLETAAQIGEPISGPVFVNDNHNQNNNCGSDVSPSMATNGLGIWIAAWSTHDFGCPQSGSQIDVVFSRSLDNGATWSDFEIVHGETVDDADVEPLVAFAQGTFIIFWKTRAGYPVNNNPGNDWDLYYVRSMDAATWSAPAPLNSDALGDDSAGFPSIDDEAPEVATDGQGTWVAVWHGRHQYSEPNQRDVEIQYAVSHDNAATWTDTQILHPDWIADSWRDDAYPDVAFGGGRFIVSWYKTRDISQTYPAGGTDDLFIATSDDGGDSWTDPRRLHDLAWEALPRLAADGNGRWALGWHRRPDIQFQDNEPWFSFSTDNGATWGAPVPDPIPNLGPDEFPQYYHDGLGTWYAVWTTQTVGQNPRDVMISRSDLGRDYWTNPESLNKAGDSATTDDYDPGLTTDIDGTTVAIWGTDLDIKAASFARRPLEIFDPNPDLLVGGAVTSDTATLGGYAEGEAVGLTADGVSRLILRREVSAAGLVEFRIADENDLEVDVGHLETIQGAVGTTTLTVPTEVVTDASGTHHYGFAVLVAPLNFIRDSGDHNRGLHDPRIVNVKAKFMETGMPDQTITRIVELHRPPVVLLHGIWSKAATWTLPLLDDPRFETENYDYMQTNDRTFGRNLRVPKHAALNAVNKLRDRQIASTQADVIAHSMGGLLTRRWIATQFYQRSDNLDAGDVHALITVDTPHLGSELADVAIGLADNSLAGNSFKRIMRGRGMCVECGAADHMRTDSPAIENLAAVTLPVHAMVGKGGSDVTDISQLPQTSRTVAGILSGFGKGFDQIFGPGVQHDTIVSRPSQEGGLPSGSTPAPACGTEVTTVFGLVDVTETNLGLHTAQTKSVVVSDCAITLLNTPVDDPATYSQSGFPAGPGPSEAAAPAAPPAEGAQEAATGGITIVAPAPASSYTPGTQVTVTVDPTGGFVPDRMLIAFDDQAELVETSPWTATFDSRPEAIGSVPVQAIGFDSNDDTVEAQDVSIEAVPTGTLTAIRIEPAVLYLDAFSPTHHVNVMGSYSDGVTRNLSASTLGTTYQSSDPAIVTIDAEGNVEAQAPGQTAIAAQSGGLDAAGTVVVLSLPARLVVDRTMIGWNGQAGAASYDLVRGDLSVLRSSGGDFTAATAECLVEDTPATSVPFTTDPAQGAGYWFLVRSNNLAGYGSYDGANTSIVGSRDTEIDLAPGACLAAP